MDGPAARHVRESLGLIEPQRLLVGANKHLKVLNQDVRRFASSRAYQFGKSTATGEDGTRYGTIYVESCTPIPESIPQSVVDVCSDLRAVLDQILWRLWVKEDPDFDKPVSFPIGDTSGRFQNSAPEHIGGLPSEQQVIFESVQPYKR